MDEVSPVSRTFRWVASWFSNCTANRFDLVAAGASGDLAYTAGYEHTSVPLDGVLAEPCTLRVTHIYGRSTAARTASGKIVHATATTQRSIRALPPRHRE
jgi:hypothetical protein